MFVAEVGVLYGVDGTGRDHTPAHETNAGRRELAAGQRGALVRRCCTDGRSAERQGIASGSPMQRAERDVNTLCNAGRDPPVLGGGCAPRHHE